MFGMQRSTRAGMGPKQTTGAGCKEMMMPVQPLSNHIPLRQHLGIKEGVQKKVAGLAQAANVAGYAPAKTEVQRAARPSFGPMPQPESCELCTLCRLPLGDLGYRVDCQGGVMHGECKAQLILKDLQKTDDARLKKDAALKRERRAKYDLGWKIQKLPSNSSHAAKLGCGQLPHALCALVWSHDNKTVTVVPTTNPAASINLEYLSLALRCRKVDGREPLFSLDPKVDGSSNKHKLWQVKRFEPAWLDGTSVGEVMFQADYHLKELSMGEFPQPVSGMRNALDFSEEQGLEQEWSAREWFIVNKAEIQVSQDNVVSARVEMGVEARETVRGPKGMEDVPLTRTDHPLVQYASAFTHYFDVIAERKSSIYHLRELAKASTMAKFLMENNAQLSEEWFSLADMSAGPSPHQEIPQMWNEQRVAQIQVEDGRIVASAKGVDSASLMHGVYGGAQLGVDELARVAGVPVGRVPTAKVTMARAPALSQRLIQARTGLAEMPLEVPGAPPGVPKGVDLNLDQFDLEAAAQAEGQQVGSWEGKDFLGRAFWKSLTAPSALNEEDKCLLRELYNPHMCDRREDCEFFAPPDASLAYVAKLRALLKEEAATRQRRKEHFCSADFDPDHSNLLFPGWRSSVTVSGGEAQAHTAALHARPDCTEEAARMVKQMRAAPNTHKTTEDGVSYRIYQLGSLEVRTIQEPGSEEAVVAVFSNQDQPQPAAEAQESWSTVARNDKLAKAILYIEQEQEQAAHFVLLETDQGDAITVEAKASGALAAIENPAGVEARRARAKVLRAVECTEIKKTVQELYALLPAQDSLLAVLCLLLPARQKAWALLSTAELGLAKSLGVDSEQAWDERSAEVFGEEWESLSPAQRTAAKDLGFSLAQWRPSDIKSKSKPQQPQQPESQKAWGELTAEQQEALMAEWVKQTYGMAAMA